MTAAALLQVQGLGVSFGGIRAVEDVSFDVRAGEVFAIVGPNGAGKTTVFNLISRVVAADRGRIAFDGHDLRAVPQHGVAALGLARTFQNLELLPTATVFDNVMLGCHVNTPTGLWAEMLRLPSVRRAEAAAHERAERAVEFLGLRPFAHRVVADVPYGTRKVAEIARALVSEPRLLLLDEPTAGLNLGETEAVGARILDIRERLGIAVLLIEHDMRFVRQVSDRMLAMNVGRVVAQGRPDDVLVHPEVVAAYLGETGDALAA